MKTPFTDRTAHLDGRMPQVGRVGVRCAIHGILYDAPALLAEARHMAAEAKACQSKNAN